MRETEQKILGEMLPKLETALIAGDTKTTNAIFGRIGTLELAESGRELYIRLNDLLFEEKTEKALELIANYKKEQPND